MHSENEIVYLHLDDIIPNRFQPREVFDERALKELALSIKEHGVIHPIIVRPVNNKYEIIAGERRYKASALAGLTKIPAIIRNLDDKEAAKIALLENLQRRNLNPIEEARTYQKILELDQMTQEELAKTMGKSQSAVANKLRLLALPYEIQDSLLKEEISERHARTLLNIKNTDEQKEMLKKVIKEKLTVRQLEDIIKQQNQRDEPIYNNNLQKPIPSSINDQLKIQNENMNSNIPNIFNKTVEEKPNLMTDLNNNISSTNNNISKDEPINYGEINDDEDEDESNNDYNYLPSNANIIPNLDELKANTKDINDNGIQRNNKQKVSADLDSLLNIKPAEDFNRDSNNKVFTPAMEALRESENSPINKEDYFSAPDLMSIELPNSSGVIREKTNNMQSPVSILDFGSKNNSPSNRIQSHNIMNSNNRTSNELQNKNSLGFALMSENNDLRENRPRGVNIQQIVSRIRNILSELERTGVKIDTDEMDFENQYQIVIRIDKNK